MINLKHSEYGDVAVIVQRLSRVRLSATPWAADHQAPLFVGFPRQEYCGGLPFLFPGDLPMQGSNLHLLHCQAYSLSLSHLGSMIIFYFILNFKIFFVMKELHQTSLNHSLAKGNKYLTSICQMTIHFISFPPHPFLQHIIFELLLFVSLDLKSQFCDLKSQSQFLWHLCFLALLPSLILLSLFFV